MMGLQNEGILQGSVSYRSLTHTFGPSSSKRLYNISAREVESEDDIKLWVENAHDMSGRSMFQDDGQQGSDDQSPGQKYVVQEEPGDKRMFGQESQCQQLFRDMDSKQVTSVNEIEEEDIYNKTKANGQYFHKHEENQQQFNERQDRKAKKYRPNINFNHRDTLRQHDQQYDVHQLKIIKGHHNNRNGNGNKNRDKIRWQISSIDKHRCKIIQNYVKKKNNSGYEQYEQIEQQKCQQQDLHNQMQQIDQLRKQLLKSTENNINAIFTTKLSAEDCQLAQMLEKINKKVVEVCGKVQVLEEKRVEELERQLNRRKRDSDYRKEHEMRRELEGDRERERERLRQIQRQKPRSKQQNIDRSRERGVKRSSNERSGNMILDLGHVNANQGKIIAVYPTNKMIDLKQLILPQHNSFKSTNQQQQQSTTNRKSYQQADPTLNQVLSTQQTFLTQLKQFQSNLTQTITRKLSQMKLYYKQNQHHQRQQQYYNRSQNLQRVSPQTDNNCKQQYDDSRGSINILYIRKLRQMEEVVRERQWEVERLQKENYYLEKQLEKVQRMGVGKVREDSREGVGRGLMVGRQERYYGQYSDRYYAAAFSKKVSSRDQFNNDVVSPLQTQNNQQNITLCFSPQSPRNTNSHNSRSSTSTQQQQRIQQHQPRTTQQLNSLKFSNTHHHQQQSKKKSTHSFHQSKHTKEPTAQLIELRKHLERYQLMLKEKDSRIRELQDTIMDHLQSSKRIYKSKQQEKEKQKEKEKEKEKYRQTLKKRQQTYDSASSRTNGYSNVPSHQQSPQVLHRKLNNLKTLLKQSQKEAETYKNLYQQIKSTQATPLSQQHTHSTKRNNILTQDTTTATSRSMCISDKTAITMQRQLSNLLPSQYPFVQIIQQQKKSHKNTQSEQETNFQSIINENNNVASLISALVDFVLMAWSLKQVIMTLCGSQVNVEKVNRNARNFLDQLKEKDVRMWRKVVQKLELSGGDDRLREIWVE